MKAALLYGARDLRVEELPDPRPGPGEVLARVDVALTCGSDLKSYVRGSHPVLAADVPAPFGHEFCGTVVELGPGVVEDFQEGDVIMSANSAPCGECYYCRRGQYSLCDDLQFLQGTYAEYVVVPARIVERNLYIKPADMSPEAAALLEPLSCVVHGFEESNTEAGDTAAVFGCGPIGLMFIRLIKQKGAQAIAIDPTPERRAWAADFGADIVLDANDDIAEKVASASPSGDGADVVVEAVGNVEAWRRAISVTRKGGRVVMFGGCPAGSKIELDTSRLHYDELSVIGVFHHTPFSVRRALTLLHEDMDILSRLATHELPLDEIDDAFKMMESQEAVKVAIRTR
ncbi:MAG: zinc-binding dehydrogenase [Candidatus Coatesbacteria bacterium]|nr:MAG: zinc-binding dehydrogenase [Candidatus Coatesbacteria bacterium]